MGRRAARSGAGARARRFRREVGGRGGRGRPAGAARRTAEGVRGAFYEAAFVVSLRRPGDVRTIRGGLSRSRAGSGFHAPLREAGHGGGVDRRCRGTPSFWDSRRGFRLRWSSIRGRCCGIATLGSGSRHGAASMIVGPAWALPGVLPPRAECGVSALWELIQRPIPARASEPVSKAWRWTRSCFALRHRRSMIEAANATGPRERLRVVHPAAAPVHGDPHARVARDVGEPRARELAAPGSGSGAGSGRC